MRWKLWVIIICAATFAEWAFAQGEIVDTALTGIISVPGYKAALLYISENSGTGLQTHEVSLKEGDRVLAVELNQVNASNGVAKLTVNGTNIDLKLAAPAAKQTSQGLRLDETKLDLVLKLYAELADRTVLRGTLPKVFISLNVALTNRWEAAAAITNALKKKGIITVLDGEKFAIVVPESQVSRVVPRSAEIKVVAKPPPANEKLPPNVLPAGSIDFPEIPLSILLPLYSELVNAKDVEWDDELRSSRTVISLKSENPLSKEEAVYALDTVLALEGVKIIRAPDNKIKAEKIQ